MSIRNVAVICGGDSDLTVVLDVLANRCVNPEDAHIDLHVISCHTNTLELIEFAAGPASDGLWAVICVGSKAFALPGILEALFYAYKKDIRVVGVAIGEDKALEAARLSIEELPGQHVVMNEGIVYCGKEGLEQALERVLAGVMPQSKPRVAKRAKINLWSNWR